MEWKDRATWLTPTPKVFHSVNSAFSVLSAFSSVFCIRLPRMTQAPAPYVSRGGQKLAHALAEFRIDVTGLTGADLGCSTGGFTDCLLQAGAAKVFAVDTAYGELAWKLRKDPRVVVMERSNALHTRPAQPVDIVVIDLGWTPQKALLPIALGWLKSSANPNSPVPLASGPAEVSATAAPAPDPLSNPSPCIITLIKPHYEAKYTPHAAEAARAGGVLPDDLSQRVMEHVVAQLPAMGVSVEGLTQSPLRGGTKTTGNLEWLALLRPHAASHSM